MAMGFKKKKNVFILSLLVGICFILYQLYFFVAISTITSNDRIIHVVDHSNFEELVVRSEEDKNVNSNGVIRGVLLINMPHYRMDSNKNFKCLTLEQYIPFHQVNDDYCDCEDSSDEPSTTACINGTFYCDTQYKIKTINSIPSNKINDGICDCCDGSDEWLHNNRKILLTQGSVKLKRHYSTKCPNLC